MCVWDRGAGAEAVAAAEASATDLLADSSAGKDVWILNSGDVVDGTGLSNLSPVNGARLTPLVQVRHPWTISSRSSPSFTAARSPLPPARHYRPSRSMP